MVHAAARALGRANCLDRSLTLWALLRRRGIHAGLQLGARKDQECFDAHAWIELDGVVLNDSDDVRQRYAEFHVPPG